MDTWFASEICPDPENRIITFNPIRPKKITGSRIASILGMNEYSTPFRAACDMLGLLKKTDTKYTRAGTVIEPVIRQSLRDGYSETVGRLIGSDRPAIIDPVPADECGYEHFPEAAPFGGMVDGYVDADGEHVAVLEIKTANDRKGWFDNGKETVPTSYILQTSLYCDLSGLDMIVFAVGFLEEEDYDRPEAWRPNEDNFIIRAVKPLPMKQFKKEALEWYRKYIMRGTTPEWSDEDSGTIDEVLDRLRFH